MPGDLLEPEQVTGYRIPSAEPPPHVPTDRIFDFDLFHDERLIDDIQLGYMSLHRDAPDVFWTPRNGGHWMVTRFADVTEIGTRPELFSSVNRGVPPVPEGRSLPLPPQDMDAPDHMRYRLLLLKFLAPKNLKKQEPFVRNLAIDLIEGLNGRSACDFKKEIAVVLPVTVFMTMMQWDSSRLYELVSWVHDVVGSDEPVRRFAAFQDMSAYLHDIIQRRMADPGSDPISVLLASEVRGEIVTPERVQEMANLLFTAGLDTVTNAMTYTMYHLARDTEMQQRLRAHPEQIGRAVEEFLRRFSFVSTVRRVTEDTVFRGVELRAGDHIVCSLAAASNDERSVPHPERVDLDRPQCPHVAFMTGPHTCVGAPLARTELRVLLEEWFKRMPDIALAPGFRPTTRGGAVASIDRLEIVW